MNENSHSTTNHKSSVLPEAFVASFSRLLLNVSGDTDTLNAFQSMISDEIERASNPDNKSDSRVSDIDLFSSTINHAQDTETEEDTAADDGIKEESSETPNITRPNHTAGSKENNKASNSHISHVPSFITKETIDNYGLEDELRSLFSGFNSESKYVWLVHGNTGMPSYSFGGKSFLPHEICTKVGIKDIMDRINTEYNLELDACLVTRYKSGEQALSLHQDNEKILDGDQPIVITSVGSSRILQFWDSNSEQNGQLIEEVNLSQGDLLIMKSGCQDLLWHRVLPNQSTSVRYAISFRKVKPAAPHQQEHQPGVLEPLVSSLVENHLEQLPGSGFMVHPTRVPQNTEQAMHISASSNIRANVNSSKASAKHLIIGDSLVKGLRVPGSISICKGGIRPGELLQLLPGSTDILHPNEYEAIRTITVIVGTNALNVKSPGKGMPLLDVVYDFEKLIHDLKDLFPQARIGLYNILPRSHTCMETIPDRTF